MLVEVRNDSIFISGYVNATGKESNFLPSVKGKFKEVIKEGVFSDAIRRAKDIQLLFNHQETRKLGSLKTGNMELKEDGVGLQIRAEISDSEIVEKVKQNRKFLNGWSFGFEDLKSSWLKTQEGYQKRIVEQINLLEISLLGGMSRPAYPSTSIFEIRDEGIHLERRYSEFEFKKSNVDFSQYERTLKLLKLKGLKI